MEFSLTIKLIILFAVIVIMYLVSKYWMDYDLLEVIRESILELEFSITGLVLTILFSSVMWAIIWGNPLWVNSIAFGFWHKLFLTVALPIVGYPLAVRALNKP